jgi:hypothetical protein
MVDNPDARIVHRHRPVFPIGAIWRQFARKTAGIIRCAKCPAPNCGRWFLRDTGCADRNFCAGAYRMQA